MRSARYIRFAQKLYIFSGIFDIIFTKSGKAPYIMKDSHGRVIDYMRISVTDRCNLRCKYCMPQDIPSIDHCEILRFEEILHICSLAQKLGIHKFKVTGGEPLVRKGCLNFLRQLKSMPGTEQVTLTTNGVLLKEALPQLLELGIDGVNISLDTMDADTFRLLTGRDEFQNVYDGILTCQASGIRTKVNSVLLRGINDHEFRKLLDLARNYPVDVRFIEIMPIGAGQAFQGYDRNTLLTMLVKEYPDYEPVTSVRGNGPANYIRIPGFKGCVGFIDAIHGKFCSSCNRVRLTSDGILKLCLYYENGIDLKALLREGQSDQQILDAMEAAVGRKPLEHQFHLTATEGREELRKMSQIGG